MPRELIDRAKRAIAIVYQSLKKHGEKVSPAISSKIIELLENPPQNLLLTYVDKTPVVGRWMANGTYVAGGTIEATTFKARVNGALYTFLVLYEILKDSSNRILNHAILHELTHIAHWRDEEFVSAFISGMARVDPEHFASDEECTHFATSWTERVAERLEPEKLVPIQVLDVFLETSGWLLLRNAEAVPPVFVLKARLSERE